MYALRQTAGVLPSSVETSLQVSTTFFSASFSLSAGPRSARIVAARTVPPQVRMSFEVYFSPRISFR